MAKAPSKRRRRPARKPRPAAPVPAGLRLALLLARLWTGGFFVVAAAWKLTGGGRSLAENVHVFRQEEYLAYVEEAIRHPPVVLGRPLEPYARFLEQVMLPGAEVFAPLVLGFEALLGVGLLLGAGVRLLAGLGFGMMLAFNLAKPDPRSVAGDPVGVYLFTTRTANWPVTVLLLVLCLGAAGRVLGVDAWLRARGPRPLRWIG